MMRSSRVEVAVFTQHSSEFGAGSYRACSRNEVGGKQAGSFAFLLPTL